MIYLHNREKFPYVGKSTRVNDGTFIKFYYKYIQPETMENDEYDNKQQLILTCSIEIEGNPKIAVNDHIVLQNGHEYNVHTISPNYEKCNMQVSDFVKQRTESLTVELR